LVIVDTTGDFKSYEVKADRSVTGDKIVKLVRKQRVDSVHEKTYKDVNGYMTGKVIQYNASSGEQKVLWSSETAGTGKTLEGISQSTDGQDVIVELRLGWHPECPDEVRTSGLSRDVISLEDTDEEEEVSGQVTMEVMAERDEKAKEVSEEFGLFRERVQLYVASRQLRSEKATSLAEALVEERSLLVNAFNHGRDLKRKYETLRNYETGHKIQPSEVIGNWMKDDVMGAFSDVSEEMLRGRDDLREMSMLSH
jgi:hypothetical protein